MVRNVLLVLPDEDLKSQVQDVLEEKLSPEELRLVHVKNEKDALEHVERVGSKPDLIISSLNISADSKSPLNRKEQRGLDLLDRIRAGEIKAVRPDVPYIILTSSIKSDQAAKVSGLRAFGLVISENLKEILGITLETLLQGPTTSGESIVELVFGFTRTEKIATKELAEYRITTHQGFSGHPVQGNLTIHSRLLKDWTSETSELRASDFPDWYNKLTKIGEQLTDALFADQKFHNYFLAAVKAAGGLKNTRIRFVIDRDYHPVALEALLEPPDYPVTSNTIVPSNVSPDSRFCMLKASITRKLIVQGRVGPLFGDDETRDRPINCLIIEADVEGFTSGPGNLIKLTNVHEEADFLEKHLNKEKSQSGNRVAEVTRISLHTLPRGTSFREHVEKTLKSSVWHLVHFAGHSYYDENSKEGSVFFPGAEPDSDSGRRIEHVAIGEFAMWLDRTRFVYLSSCHNSEDNIGFDLARHGVPALISFRWDIEDEKASKYACTFYEALLKGPPSLERTFVEARHAMYEKYREHRIWAAPMLILQS